MQGKVESGSLIAPSGDVLALGLASRRSQHWPRHHALLAILPFLALGGRCWSHAEDALRGRSHLPAMPWLTPRWFGWPAHDAPPTRIEESGARLPGSAGPSGPPSSEDRSPAQHLATLTPALSGVLNLVRRRRAVTGHTPRPSLPWRPTPTAPKSRIQRSPSGGDLISNGSPADRAGPETGMAVQGETGRPETKVPGAVGSLMPRLSAATPAWRLLNVLPGFALGAALADLPAGGARHPTLPRRPAHGGIPFGLPWPRVYGGGVVKPQGRPSAPSLVEAGTLLPLPERKPHAGREPGPYASTPLQGLTMVAGAIGHLVEREVKAEVKRQREEMQSRAPGRPDARSSPMAADVTSDETARLLMQRIRTLAQEERFRSGRLR